jgi:hypothetical protein
MSRIALPFATPMELYKMRIISTLVAASILIAITPSIAEPVAPNHPLVGTWRITLNLRGRSCDEIHTIRPDGTRQVTSAEELGESEYEVSDQPSEKGFYKWVDTITKDNGKPDCLGYVTQVGRVAKLYVIFDSSGDKFFMCLEESRDRCAGPFVRQK